MRNGCTRRNILAIQQGGQPSRHVEHPRLTRTGCDLYLFFTPFFSRHFSRIDFDRGYLTDGYTLVRNIYTYQSNIHRVTGVTHNIVIVLITPRIKPESNIPIRHTSLYGCSCQLDTGCIRYPSTGLLFLRIDSVCINDSTRHILRQIPIGSSACLVNRTRICIITDPSCCQLFRWRFHLRYGRGIFQN